MFLHLFAVRKVHIVAQAANWLSWRILVLGEADNVAIHFNEPPRLPELLVPEWLLFLCDSALRAYIGTESRNRACATSYRVGGELASGYATVLDMASERPPGHPDEQLARTRSYTGTQEPH